MLSHPPIAVAQSPWQYLFGLRPVLRLRYCCRVDNHVLESLRVSMACRSYQDRVQCVVHLFIFATDIIFAVRVVYLSSGRCNGTDFPSKLEVPLAMNLILRPNQQQIISLDYLRLWATSCSILSFSQSFRESPHLFLELSGEHDCWWCFSLKLLLWISRCYRRASWSREFISWYSVKPGKIRDNWIFILRVNDVPHS